MPATTGDPARPDVYLGRTADRDPVVLRTFPEDAQLPGFGAVAWQGLRSLATTVAPELTAPLVTGQAIARGTATTPRCPRAVLTEVVRSGWPAAAPGRLPALPPHGSRDHRGRGGRPPGTPLSSGSCWTLVPVERQQVLHVRRFRGTRRVRGNRPWCGGGRGGRGRLWTPCSTRARSRGRSPSAHAGLPRGGPHRAGARGRRGDPDVQRSP
ncbi:hypothetical protein QJS66_22455 [Kocuria rhizophila]|nr:hypothetical protein QJS66_22455 [Kocuria rhizophila]